jgi:M6 family metalloprotease-like protein
MKINSVKLNLSHEPYFIGTYSKIKVNAKGINFDDLDFVITEGAPGGYISVSRDVEFDPANPDIMICFGFKPGTYHIEVRKKIDGLVLATFEYKLDALWRDSVLGPSLSFHGVNSGYAFGASWGGGNAGQPQNMSVVPTSGTRKVALLLVDTSSQRYPTNATDLQAIKDLWLQNLKTGFQGTDGISRSARTFYQETCFSQLNSFDVDGNIFEPVHLSSDFDSYISKNLDENGKYIDGWGNPMNGFDQSCITAADDQINYNDYQSIIFIVQTWNTVDSDGNPLERAPWPQAWGGTYTTADGSKTLNVLVMPHNWSVKPIYATIAHELGHNLGLGDQYGKDYYSADVNNRTTGDWELMDNEVPLPQFTIAHRMMLGWMQAGWLKLYNFALNGGAPVDEMVTLQTIETCPPTAGRYAGIEVRIADGYNYYVEYRKGQNSEISDRQLPNDSAVLVTEVISEGYSTPISRPCILKIPNDADGDGPVLTNGLDFKATDNSDPTYPTDFRISVSGIDGTKADVRIQYGVNSRPDPSIRPWPASPDRQYQSPDIEVKNARNAADPAWFNVPWVGHQNTIVAKIKNSGNLDAPEVKANFFVKDYTIGGAPEFPLESDQHDVNALATVDFSSEWFPPADGHYCVIVRIPLYQLPANPAVVEMTELNNMAQSNYDRFISATGSPASREITTVTVGNPYPRTTRIFIIPHQTNPLYRTYIEHTTLTLEPGATRKVKLMFEHDPQLIFKLPVSVGNRTIDASNALNRYEAERYTKIFRSSPNHARFASFIEDPFDPHHHSKNFLAGADVQVVTGRKTQFEYFEIKEEVVSGAVRVVENKQRVTSGKVILIFEIDQDGKVVESYRTILLDSQGTFTFKLSEIKEEIKGVQCYYVPGAGYGDCYSNRLAGSGKRVRVILDKIQILNDHDPCIKGKGELTFTAVVVPDNDPSRKQVTRLPSEGVFKVSDKPGENSLLIGITLFDGLVKDRAIAISISGKEIDLFDPDDELNRYHREFSGDPETWYGQYFPTDEYLDKEDVGDWALWFRIVRN